MSEAVSFDNRIKEIRSETLNLISDFCKTGPELELPAPKPALAASRAKISQDQYNVLVIGEMKRGKSSFINAMIGRDILPTNVGVATSQVFRVSYAAEESYYVQFEDGSTKEISLKELPRYGSQVVADAEGTPELSEVIRWIEVNVPAKFLPDGVSILDTPGLGSLYASHGEITQRLIPQADAVVYVIDTQYPLINEDKRMIKKILDVTSDIFFVQTKTDQVRVEDWQAMRGRNEALLQTIFNEFVEEKVAQSAKCTDSDNECTDEQTVRNYWKKQLHPPHVWPVSSKLLIKAAAGQSVNEKFMAFSHYRELAAALRAFLYRSVGLARASEAGALLNSYYQDNLTTLKTRLATLSETDKNKRLEYQRRLSANRQAFEAEWGTHGSVRTQMMENLIRTARNSRQAFQQALQRNGHIEQQFREEIEKTEDVEAINGLLQHLNADVNAATDKAWQASCAAVAREYAKIAQKLSSDSIAIQAGVDDGTLVPVGGDVAYVKGSAEQGWFAQCYEHAKSGIREAQPSMLLGGLGATITAGLGLTVLPALLVVGAVGTAIWAFMKGTKTPSIQKRNQARQEAQTYLTRVMTKLWDAYFGVDLASGAASRVDDYFEKVTQSAQSQIQDCVQSRMQEVREEEAKLREAAESEDLDRRRQLADVTKRLNIWQALGARLLALDKKYAAMDQILDAQQPHAA